MNQVLLRGKNVSRQWGGLLAVNQVNIEIFLGKIHAVIGTNGAGKSTLINLLAGEIPLSSGSVELLEQDVSVWSEPRRAHLGLGKSFQKNTIFPDLSVFENCRLAAQARYQRPWKFWETGESCTHSRTQAQKVLLKTGLHVLSEKKAGLLSHGQKRQLEVAMCLATNPKVLLLDEPLAGMGAEETNRMLNFLNDLRAENGILLVEHDMDAVFQVADMITVMVNGAVIACGTPPEIKNNKDVQIAYLGVAS